MPLKEMLDRLATFEPVDLPVISLYLNTQADGRGDADMDSFVLEELKAKAQTFTVLLVVIVWLVLYSRKQQQRDISQTSIKSQ
jgi:hypothetical protein